MIGKIEIALCILKLAMRTSPKILRQFGGRMKELRKNKNLSQEELGSKANLHRTYIGMVERAEKNITLINIAKIAQALDVNIKDLFENEKEPPTQTP